MSEDTTTQEAPPRAKLLVNDEPVTFTMTKGCLNLLLFHMNVGAALLGNDVYRAMNMGTTLKAIMALEGFTEEHDVACAKELADLQAVVHG